MPGGQSVSEQFQVDWATVLVSSFSTIVIRFDGHGSGFQGTSFLHKVRRKLGQLEERDQLEALRYASCSSHDGDRRETHGNEKLIFLLCLDWYPKSLTSTRLELEFMGRWEELMLPSLPYGAVSPLVEWVIQEPKGWLLFLCQCAWAKYWILKCSLWAWKHVVWQQLPIGSVSVCVNGLIKGFVKHFGVPLRCWKHYISAI